MGNTYIFDDSHDYTGAIATFTDTHGTSRITNISVPLSPIQDLHGYDSPWPAGGGVNILPPQNISGSMSDVAVFSDRDTITLNGTASAYGQVISNSTVTLAVGTYTIKSFTASGTGLCQFQVRSEDGTTMYANANVDTSASFTLTEPTTVKCRVTYVSGAVLNNLKIKPMIVKGDSAPTTYSPYSNICPISGRTGLSVYRTGKNLCYRDPNVNSNIYNGGNLIPVKAGDKVYCYGEWTYTQSAGLWGGIFASQSEINKNNRKVQFGGFTSGGVKEYTITEDGYFGVAYNAGFYTYTIEKMMISLSPITGATDYEPYQGTTYAIDWTTEAGTVYGGTLDVVTGELTVTMAEVTLKGTERFTLSNASGNNPRRFMRSTSAIGIATPADNDERDISTHFKYQKTATATEAFGTFRLSSYLTFPDANSEFADATAFNNWLTTQNTNGTPVKIAYELATPLTYQLTPQEVSVIKNSLNNVWASTGSSITVTVKDIAYGFQGWLVKVGSSLTLVPTEMIEAESYKVTPDQRMEESAERDTTGYLWRDTVRNTPPKIEFNTPPVNNTQVAALNAIFQSAFTVKSQRKLQVAFFDPEEDCYKIWDCYMPDVEYPMHLIDPDAKTILYDSIRYAFIGY